ncbi:hypothetical protein NDU88_002996 [Pleurodeles waltl]|uniref:Uncharacterized protein n=1 Tax=Pleurodeles waltl TaxID=8319 RepID=A0AAV7UBA5_PLEWA|nr:hypothetical protein NDU88_002996 [Pleurodeles waltl]
MRICSAIQGLEKISSKGLQYVAFLAPKKGDISESTKVCFNSTEIAQLVRSKSELFEGWGIELKEACKAKYPSFLIRQEETNKRDNFWTTTTRAANQRSFLQHAKGASPTFTKRDHYIHHPGHLTDKALLGRGCDRVSPIGGTAPAEQVLLRSHVAMGTRPPRGRHSEVALTTTDDGAKADWPAGGQRPWIPQEGGEEETATEKTASEETKTGKAADEETATEKATSDFNLNMAKHGKRSSRKGSLDQRLGIPPQEWPFRDKDKCDYPLVRLLEALGPRALNGRFPTDIPINQSHTAKKSASTLH